MATFDTGLRQIIGPKVEQRNGRALDYSVNQIPSIRNFHDGAGTKLNLEQPFICTDAEWTTIDTFYKINRDLDFTFPWHGDGQNHTMRFTAPPRHFRGDLVPGFRYVILSLGEV